MGAERLQWLVDGWEETEKLAEGKTDASRETMLVKKYDSCSEEGIHCLHTIFHAVIQTHITIGRQVRDGVGVTS